MSTIASLGLSANQWQFLSKPEAYVKASGDKFRLECLKRQFRTASDILKRLNGSYRERASRGILLADDVGLGKTTVAALVAWVAASGGRKVRILAPNDVMVRRWKQELASHVGPCGERATMLEVRAKRVIGESPLAAGSIQVVKHSYARKGTLKCDLLIIDEAHHAKGENAKFGEALKRHKKSACRILILTATPFSIHLPELNRMLSLVGGDEAHVPVRSFSLALNELYSEKTTRDSGEMADLLFKKAHAAVDKMSRFVIRNGIDNLPSERVAFGKQEEWTIKVPRVGGPETELMLRMGRALRVAKDAGDAAVNLTNDPRFDVGWRHFDHVIDDLSGKVAPRLDAQSKALAMSQLKSIRASRKLVDKVHSKVQAVGDAVLSTIKQNEKVLLFCHYHATAQELTIGIGSMLKELEMSADCPAVSVWKAAWDELLASAKTKSEERLRETFIDWLCSDLVRSQTWNWVPKALRPKGRLAPALRKTHGRGYGAMIDAAAQSLFDSLLDSPSSRAVLREAGKNGKSHVEYLPGGNGKRILGVCDLDKSNLVKENASLFTHNVQPDTVIAVFNSPFGPDVLVVTDKLSEGVDLHRYCRHLIHYELDPSPVRTMQRNGRVRRVNSWASITHKPILYAYPAFLGTRDERLVQIMKKRIGSFSLLLGGAQHFDVDKVQDSDEAWRSAVMAKATKRLAKAGTQLGTQDL